MVRYETLFLARTEITDEETAMVEKQLEKLVSDAQGKLDSFDKWGKYRLAYPVNKSSHGVYMLARYQIPPAQTEKVLQEFDRFIKIKCHETVMRYVNVKLAANASTTYIKPDSIDISRSGSLDSFIKGNNIENLLHSMDSTQGKNLEIDNDMDEQA